MQTKNLAAWRRNPETDKIDASIFSGSRAGWGLESGHYRGYVAPIAIHPRPDSETSQYARHRINAVGQKYRIPIVVGHGAWPFKFQILTAPAGTTIGETLLLSGNSLVAGTDYGVVELTNPTAGTHTFEILAIDQNNIKTYFRWTLVVNDANWVYLDGAAAGGGNGSFATPYNSIQQLIGMTNKGVLVKQGSVDWNSISYTGIGLNIAKVFVPYNEGDVVFNQGTSSTLMLGLDDCWFSGIKFKIPSGRNNLSRWMIFEATKRTIFFENIIDLESLSNTGGRSNASFVHFADSTQSGDNCAFINNQFNNISERDFLLTYATKNLVIEGNTVLNSSVGAGFGHGFYLKMSTFNATVRNNRSVGTVNGQKLVRIDSYQGNPTRPMDFIEVCYNSYYNTGTEAAIFSGLETVAYGDARYIYRNSIVSTGSVAIQANGATTTDTITIAENVLMSNQGSPNGYAGSFAGTIDQSNNVYANLASGMLDSNCELQGAYLTNLGTRGAELI